MFLSLQNSNMCGKEFSIYVFKFLENSLNHAPVPHWKLPVEFFENLFLTKTEWLEEALIRCIKIQSKNMKMTLSISLFTFCMIYNFSKCDGFTVL